MSLCSLLKNTHTQKHVVSKCIIREWSRDDRESPNLSDSFPSSPQCHPFMPFCCWNEFPDLNMMTSSNENRFRVTGPFYGEFTGCPWKSSILILTASLHMTPNLLRTTRLNTPQVFHHIGFHDDVIKRKHIPRYWPFVRGIHRRPGEFHAQRPVTQSFDVFFDQRPNKRLSKQLWDWQFETPSSPLWRHSNVLFARTGMWKLKQFWHSRESMVPVSSIVEHIMKTLAIFAWSGVFISKLTLPAVLSPRDFGSLYLLYESRFPIFSEAVVSAIHFQAFLTNPFFRKNVRENQLSWEVFITKSHMMPHRGRWTISPMDQMMA